MTDRSTENTRSRAAHGYSTGEEIANAVTHGLGVALGIAGLVILVVPAAIQGDAWRVTAFAIYGATLVFLYSASTLYHSIPFAGAKRILQRLDHAAIYFLIAGSYTPVMLVTLRGAVGWTMFGVVWGIALAGVLLEFLAGTRWRKLSVLVYLALGWTCVFVFGRIWSSLPGAAIALLVAGGVTYSAGVAFYLWHRLPYAHAIWHLFVLGGSVCHFLMFLLYVLPQG
jgi:hemolysin III